MTDFTQLNMNLACKYAEEDAKKICDQYWPTRDARWMSVFYQEFSKALYEYVSPTGNPQF